MFFSCQIVFDILLFLSGSCRMGTVHDAKPRFAIKMWEIRTEQFFLVDKFNLQTSKAPHPVSKLTTLSCKARVFLQTKRWGFVGLAPIRQLPDGARTIILFINSRLTLLSLLHYAKISRCESSLARVFLMVIPTKNPSEPDKHT